MTKKLPAKIFVKYEEPKNDEPYLVASEKLYGLVDLGDKIKIGTYILVETTEAEMVVSTSRPVKAPIKR
jgi:hypothetical protein